MEGHKGAPLIGLRGGGNACHMLGASHHAEETSTILPKRVRGQAAAHDGRRDEADPVCQSSHEPSYSLSDVRCLSVWRAEHE